MSPLRIDIERLRGHLEARLGIRLVSCVQRIDGGIFPAIRPWDLEENHGFCVAVARTPREVSASFHLDTYAGTLLRVMSDAGDDAMNTFAALKVAAEARQSRIVVEINGEVSCPKEVTGGWGAFGIEVSSRLALGGTEEGLHHVAIDAASCCLALALSLIPLEEVDQHAEGALLPEGAKLRVEVNRYERSPASRAACIAFHGLKCKGCNFDFAEAYGSIGEGYIEVHHLTPISRMAGEYLVDPVRDLVPLCSNCHAVIHRTDPPLQLGALQRLVRRERRDSHG